VDGRKEMCKFALLNGEVLLKDVDLENGMRAAL
jgi:hypothetical protein